MSTWLNKAMCNTLDFILRKRMMAYYRSVIQSAELKKKIQYYENQLPGGHSGCFPDFRIRIIWIIFISKCRKGIFFIDCLSVTCKLLMLKAKLCLFLSQQTFEGTDNKSKSLPTLYSKFFPNLQKRMGVGQMLVGNSFSFVLWKALTPRRVLYCPTCRW